MTGQGENGPSQATTSVASVQLKANAKGRMQQVLMPPRYRT